jgi:hypothetical protein
MPLLKYILILIHRLIVLTCTPTNVNTNTLTNIDTNTHTPAITNNTNTNAGVDLPSDGQEDGAPGDTSGDAQGDQPSEDNTDVLAEQLARVEVEARGASAKDICEIIDKWSVKALALGSNSDEQGRTGREHSKSGIEKFARELVKPQSTEDELLQAERHHRLAFLADTGQIKPNMITGYVAFSPHIDARVKLMNSSSNSSWANDTYMRQQHEEVFGATAPVAANTPRVFATAAAAATPPCIFATAAAAAAATATPVATTTSFVFGATTSAAAATATPVTTTTSFVFGATTATPITTATPVTATTRTAEESEQQ